MPSDNRKTRSDLKTMARIVRHQEVPLSDLVIGKGQVRTRDLHKGIDELADSIDKLGLLQPIVVCAASAPGKWEILTGQRRFLAHKILGRDTITAAILDGAVDEAEAKTISITENLIRRKLSGPDLIDGITYLYKHYGSIKHVAQVTGIPYSQVSANVKYPRLIPDLKAMVDDGVVDITVALKAQDAVSPDREDANASDAVVLATEMAKMSGAQQAKLIKERKRNPANPVSDAIEDARTGGKITQIIVTLTADAHTALRRLAADEKTTQDEVAADIIREGLSSRGLLDE